MKTSAAEPLVLAALLVFATTFPALAAVGQEGETAFAPSATVTHVESTTYARRVL